MEPTNNAPQINESAQTQQRPPSSHLLRKKDEITPKIGQREAYKAYDNTPFAPYEKSNLYHEDYINNRVEQRMRMQEKAAEKMDQGITNKDKFITRKGQEQFYFHGNMENYHIKKTQEKYEQLQKKNAGYKITKEQEDKYYKIEDLNSILDLNFIKDKKEIWDKITVTGGNDTMKQLLIGNKTSKKKCKIDYIGFGRPKFEGDEDFFDEIFNYVTAKNHLIINKTPLDEGSRSSLTIILNHKGKTQTIFVGKSQEEEDKENKKKKKKSKKSEKKEKNDKKEKI